MSAILTFAEASERLRVSDKTLRGILNRHELPGRKVGATWRVREDDVEAYLGGKTWPSTSEATSGTTTSPLAATATADRRGSVVRLPRGPTRNSRKSARPWDHLVAKSPQSKTLQRDGSKPA